MPNKQIGNMSIFLVHTKSEHEIVYAIKSEKDLTDPKLKEEIAQKIVQFGPADLKQTWIKEEVTEVGGPFTDKAFLKLHDVLFPEAKEMSDEDKLLVVNYEKFEEAGLMLEDKELI